MALAETPWGFSTANWLLRAPRSQPPMRASGKFWRRLVAGALRAAATLTTLLVLPSIYALVLPAAKAISPSLDPDDPDSAYRTSQGHA